MTQPEVAQFSETAPVSWWESCLSCVNLSLRRGARHCQGKQKPDQKEKKHELWQESSVFKTAERQYDTGNAGGEAECKPICKIFNCTLDNLFREEIDKRSDAYSDLRTEEVKGFRYVEYTVISREPEADAIGRMCKCAEENGIANPKVIGWDFPKVSQEQVNVFNMHGYTAALILPEGVTPEGYEIKEQAAHKYAAIHIDRPFDNPFSTISEVIPCFETDGESMDIYMACK